MHRNQRLVIGAVAALLALAPALNLSAAPNRDGRDRGEGNSRVKRVLLISIDGMHSIDFINCAAGISSINGGASYCPTLAELQMTGVNFLDATTSKPSDSFPGLMAIVSGGSPRSVGAFYDVAFDRVLAPPTITTGNSLPGGNCSPNMANGTTTEFDEGIDKNETFLNGIDGFITANGDGGRNAIDPQKLPRDPFAGCTPVFPWNFVRTNTIFGVIHAGGGYTAWSDKHPSYSSVAGPGNNSNLDDYYSPEINSDPTNPANTIPGCNLSAGDPNFSNLGAWTDSFVGVRCYDTLKVNAILNEIDGFTHNRSHAAPVPTIFGMNFQAVSVGQKLIEKSVGKGGYLDSIGTPSPLLLQEIEFVDGAIGQFVSELKKTGHFDDTLIVITAKHGQSPVDSARYQGIGVPAGSPISTTPATILSACLDASENSALGPTEDDVSLLWINQNACSTSNAVTQLETTSPTSNNVAGIGQIFWGPGIRQLYNAPGLPPDGDPRTPDIIVAPNVGVTYSGSSKKQAEHGGFAHDDTNVMMLFSNPKFRSATVPSPVETMQVAPTILAALGLDPAALESVRMEGTQALSEVLAQLHSDRDRD